MPKTSCFLLLLKLDAVAVATVANYCCCKKLWNLFHNFLQHQQEWAPSQTFLSCLAIAGPCMHVSAVLHGGHTPYVYAALFNQLVVMRG